MRFINRKVPIADVARALNLRLDGARKIHCWRPDRHKNGDRSASVGIRIANNTVKCFGCDSKPIGPIDMVMAVRELGVADAALWIAGRFDVPMIPAGKRLEVPGRRRDRVGHERGLELLIRSGLWATLSESARSIAPVLLAMSEKKELTDQECSIQISYIAVSRYSGIQSPNSIRKALTELEEMGFLRCPEAGLGRSPARNASHYIVTPTSEALTELAHAFSAQTRNEIAAEREIRARLKSERVRALKERSRHTGLYSAGAGQGGSNAAPLPYTPIPAQKDRKTKQSPAERVGTKYKPLYPTNSANQQPAIPRIARSLTLGPRIDAEVNG